jgi:hypothetical protein
VGGDVIAQRVKELREFVSQYMVEGEDHGTIPGTPKPTLFKPGAEKLCDVYGFQRLCEVTHRVEDWENGLFHYEVRVDLVSMRSGLIVAQGLGSANSKEARHRWRDEKPACRDCGRELRRSQQEWYCWRKKGGCGATYGLQEITPGGRVENDDPYTLVNTLLKMAKKRALVDAVLSATRSSGLFTQDIEDMPAEATPKDEPPTQHEAPPAAPPAPKPSARRAPPARKQPPPDAEGDDDGERSKLFGLATEMWGDKDAHAAICAALSLPSDGEGAIREHWLDKGGTYKQAQPYLAEVRRHEVGGKSFEDACRIVNAYAQLTETGEKAT